MCKGRQRRDGRDLQHPRADGLAGGKRFAGRKRIRSIGQGRQGIQDGTILRHPDLAVDAPPVDRCGPQLERRPDQGGRSCPQTLIWIVDAVAQSNEKQRRVRERAHRAVVVQDLEQRQGQILVAVLAVPALSHGLQAAVHQRRCDAKRLGNLGDGACPWRCVVLDPPRQGIEPHQCPDTLLGLGLAPTAGCEKALHPLLD